MLHYILQASLVWLMALAFYELLLKLERFHRYNRFYLLTTLLLGFLLPAIPIKKSIVVEPTATFTAVEKVFIAKEKIVHQPIQAFSKPIEYGTLRHENKLWILYLLGVSAALIFLLKDVVYILNLYKRGKKNRAGRSIIIETQKPHGPFSLLHYIFISSKENYSAEEWNFILWHEQEHYKKGHTLDIAFMSMVKVLFWFHPLPYFYNKYLKWVHEFQADAAAGRNKTDYCHFLIEQNFLQGVPALSHPFHSSSLKIRILMLTQFQPSKTGLLKYYATLPLLLVCILLCTQTLLSEKKNAPGLVIHSNGNKIEMGEVKVIPYNYREFYANQKKIMPTVSLAETVMVKDARTGAYVSENVELDTIPVFLNGKPIYGIEGNYDLPNGFHQFTPPVFASSDVSLDAFLFNQLKPELDKLENGVYVLELDGMVVNDKGEVSYVQKTGIQTLMGSEEIAPIIPSTLNASIQRKIIELLTEYVKFNPALMNGKPVNFRWYLGNYQIKVKKHEAKLEERMGC